MSKLVVCVLVLFVAGYFVDGVLIKKLKHRRLSATELLKRRNDLPTNSKLLQIGMPFDYIFEFIDVGTPPKSFEVSIETGYNKLFLLDPTYAELTPYNEVYDPSNSSTSIQYGVTDDGFSGVNTLRGPRFGDNINILDRDFKQTFNTITQIDTSNYTEPYLAFSGVLGFAWDPSELKNEVNQDSSPLLNFAKKGNFPPIISIWQERDVLPGITITETIMGYGSPELGGVCADDLQYFPITNYDSYAGLKFKVGGFKFGSYSKNADFTGKLDTGVSIIYFPPAIGDRISRLINPTFNTDLFLYTTDCSKADTLQDWVFTIGGRKFSVPASQYIIDIDIGNNQCVVAFGYFSQFTPDFVFGMPLLRQYCSVYDAQNNQVGLSTAIHATFGTTSASNAV